MNSTHIHLLVTHLPIFASIIGALVLAYGIWMKSRHTKLAAYFILILAALGGTTAYLTGEPAEESVEHLAGVSEDRIEEHEDAAFFALTALLITGVASIGAVYASARQLASERTIAIGVLVLSAFTFSVVARTGYLGGQIRHAQEIESAGADAQR